jgi:muconolactone delta-isomerase
MEFLVSMTTHVPEGTPQEEIDDVRAREAANSRRLAEQGHLLRLWRPPLRPGEWRTLGLFAAPDAARLEEVLATMPLRVWRSDEVTPLAAHPNDPGPTPATAPDADTEFLVTFVQTEPEDAPPQGLEDATTREAARTRELAGKGHLARLWRTSDTGRALGLWRATNAAELQGFLDSLPLAPWLTTEATQLSEHPNDPGLTGD